MESLAVVNDLPLDDDLSLHNQLVGQETSSANNVSDCNASLPIISLPGGSSDHVSFAYDLGIPTSYPEFRPNNDRPFMPAYHTAFDNVKVAFTFTDPPPLPGSDDSTLVLPRHCLIARLLLAMTLKLTSSPRLPIYPHDLASRLVSEWQQSIVLGMGRRMPQFGPQSLEGLGIRLEWITEDLDSLKRQAMEFEDHIDDIQSHKHKFPSHVNRLLGGFSKTFSQTTESGLRFHNTIMGVGGGFRTAFFPQVRSTFEALITCLQLSNGDGGGRVNVQSTITLGHDQSPPTDNAELTVVVKNLKHALSTLSALIVQAKQHLENGLVGLSLPTKDYFD